MTVCVKAKYFDVSSLAHLPLEDAQPLRNNTRNRLGDTCCIPDWYHRSEALPAQPVPTNHVTSLRRHIFGCACLLSAQVVFITGFVEAQPEGDFLGMLRTLVSSFDLRGIPPFR